MRDRAHRLEDIIRIWTQPCDGISRIPVRFILEAADEALEERGGRFYKGGLGPLDQQRIIEVALALYKAAKPRGHE